MTKKTTVLYVDDEDILRNLVADQLASEGFAVETADDGDTALEILGRKSFDVLLLDIRMPRVSGIEVLKQLKAKKHTMRIVVLTAVDDLAVAIEAVKNGANDYLTKPYELATLVAAIQRVLSH